MSKLSKKAQDLWEAWRPPEELRKTYFDPDTEEWEWEYEDPKELAEELESPLTEKMDVPYQIKQDPEKAKAQFLKQIKEDFSDITKELIADVNVADYVKVPRGTRLAEALKQGLVTHNVAEDISREVVIEVDQRYLSPFIHKVDEDISDLADQEIHVTHEDVINVAWAGVKRTLDNFAELVSSIYERFWTM